MISGLSFMWKHCHTILTYEKQYFWRFVAGDKKAKIYLSAWRNTLESFSATKIMQQFTQWKRKKAVALMAYTQLSNSVIITTVS